MNALDCNGWTALHTAAFHGRLGCLQLLHRWGGHLDEADNTGNTPGMSAATEFELHIICEICNKSISMAV